MGADLLAVAILFRKISSDLSTLWLDFASMICAGVAIPYIILGNLSWEPRTDPLEPSGSYDVENSTLYLTITVL